MSELQKNFSFELMWRGFELHPETPAGGIKLEQLFGTARARALQQSTRQFAKERGVVLNLPDTIYNTRKALILAEYARECKKLDVYRDLLMTAYWQKNQHIEDDGILNEILKQAGLPLAADEVLKEDKYISKIEEAKDDAWSNGVSGIPTVMFNGVPIVGAQSYEFYERIFKKFI